MGSTVYCVLMYYELYVLCIVYYALCTVYYVLYSALHCILCTMHCVLYYVLCPVYCALYTMYYVLCTVHYLDLARFFEWGGQAQQQDYFKNDPLCSDVSTRWGPTVLVPNHHCALPNECPQIKSASI